MKSFRKPVERQEYRDYSIESALAAVTEIGRRRSPKFVIDGHNRAVYENMVRWIHNDPAMTCMDPKTGKSVPGRLGAGIFVAGGTGTGKSWLFDIMAEYARTAGMKASFGGYVRGLSWTNVSVYGICGNYAATGDLSFYRDVEIIGINDVGVEPLESVYMGNKVPVIKEILESRGDDESKMTLITSNLKIAGDILEQRYGRRVVSRLFSMCNYMVLSGPDRRML